VTILSARKVQSYEQVPSPSYLWLPDIIADKQYLPGLAYLWVMVTLGGFKPAIFG
jgi:hypothetical protein